MEADPSCVFDLLYTEQRLGGFHCPGAYIWPTGAEESFNFMTTPLAVELMIRLPESVRAAGTLQEAIVREAWPDLLQLPFNKAISPKLKAAHA